MKIRRRQFIRSTAAGAVGAALGFTGCVTAGKPRGNKIPVGLQLYTLRNECKTDFPGAIAAAADIGFRGVEFAGYWNRSAGEIRRLLDDHGLVACGSHTPYNDVLPDKLAATIEFNQILGNKFIIVPSMTAKTRQEWRERAAQFNELADRLKPHGLWIGYHAHAHDFQPMDGERPWDVFFGQTKREVIMQLDTANCCEGGADPVTVLNQYPGRVRTIHIKPFGAGPEAIIGEDTINWPAVFDFCETRGNTQWYVVEHETSKNPLQTARRTFEKLRALGKV
ncbi:MAG TPA: TIM barrel protein [Verrucomicrobiae bacterium]